MRSCGQRNCLQTADFSVQAGGYAGARAEKIILGSRFLSPIRAVCWCLGRENYLREQISQSNPGVYCRVGREIAYRQQISLPKPGGMLSRGQRNFLQTADFSVQAGRILSCGQKVRHTCAVKSVRKRIYLTRKNTCGSLVT